MRLPRFFLGSIAALLVCTCVGLAQAQQSPVQEATPYFHEAAQQYVAADLQQALATVNEGLRIAPDDARLQALREAIQQQRQQSGQGGGGQNDAPQSGQNTSHGGDQSGDNPQSQDGNTEQPNRSNEEPNAPSPSRSAGDGETVDPPPPNGPQSESGQAVGQGSAQGRPGLSQAQAARILRALESQEKQLLRQVLKRDRKPQRILKEW